jgi:hypothetical protein
MTEPRQPITSVEVGPGSPANHHLTKSVSLAIDPAAEERCRELVGWHLDPFLEIAGGLTPELRATVARIAVLRLIELMDGGDADALLKSLARRIIETRKLET